MSDIDDLFNRRAPVAADWPNTLTPDEREWYDRLVERTKERGELPVTKRAADDFHRRFGRTVSPTTLHKYLGRALG